MTKKLFTLFTLLTLFFGVGWAETVTVTKTMNEIVTEYDYIVSSESNIIRYAQCFVDDNIFLTTNISAFWGTSTTELRVDGTNASVALQLVAAEGCTLQSVTFTFTDASDSTGVLSCYKNSSPYWFDVTSGTPMAVSGNPVEFAVFRSSEDHQPGQIGITSISVTYEKRDRVVGDWHRGLHVNTKRYEYIILNKDKTKVAGSYENGHFTALPCEGNVEFCDEDLQGTETVKVTGVGVKRFTIEYDSVDANWTRYYYLKDTDGNYYYPDANGNIVASKQSNVFKSSSGAVSIINDNNRIVYNSDEDYFGSITGTTNKGDLVMYFRPKAMTLKEIKEEENMREKGYYIIRDELQVVKSIVRFGLTNTVALVCKENGPAYDATDMSIISDNCEDFMTVHTGFSGDWDQSNWILLKPSVLSYSNVEKFKACEGKRLAANFTVFIDRDHMIDNLVGDVEAKDLEIAPQVDTAPTTYTYTPNLYCPANFLAENHNGNATGHDAEGNPTQKHYFFMNPKLQEYCEITYAVWTIRKNQYGEIHGYFVLPTSDGTNNQANIYGAVRTHWDFNNDPGAAYFDSDAGVYVKQDWPDGLVEGAMYNLHGIVYSPIYIKGEPPYKKGEPSSLKEDEEDVILDGYYRIYPVDFDPVEHIVTGIKDVVDVTDKTVAGVKYYNLAGIESDRPFEGVNIIVTTYTDGSRSSTKVLK